VRHSTTPLARSSPNVELVEEIHRECLELQRRVLPKSALGQAVNYCLNMWPTLRRCFDYAEVELSNNLAENSMRPVAVGRKNWLHVGSQQAGPKVAAILSIVESCRRLGVPVKEYLLDVLPGLDQRKRSELPQLTPARWAAAHPGLVWLKTDYRVTPRISVSARNSGR
jgi:transposase